MPDLKILNACWIVEMWLILNRFGKTMKCFHELFTRIEKKKKKIPEKQAF